jgi:hypothetical protein
MAGVGSVNHGLFENLYFLNDAQEGTDLFSSKKYCNNRNIFRQLLIK